MQQFRRLDKMEWKLTFKAVGKVGKGPALTKTFLVTAQTRSSTLLDELLKLFANHANGLEFTSGAVDEEALDLAPRVLLEDVVTSLQQDKPLSILNVDQVSKTACLAVAGSIGSAIQMPLQRSVSDPSARPAKKGRIQSGLGQPSTAGTNPVLDLAATRFTNRVCDFLLKREADSLHPYQPLEQQPEWVMPLVLELCKSSTATNDYAPELLRKKVTK